ncbi:MAG: hypothetical protein KBF78_01875 [Fuscovulum sp.]|jgi:hypothetical protein|nr:hypothetical protein [Fuscovulum sp.]
MRRTTAVLTLALILAGCGGLRDSKLNPFNWFGKSEETEKLALPERPADARALVETVLTLQVEDIPGGAIVRATGLTPTQGWWQAELVPLPVEAEGRLVLEFRIFPPIDDTAVSTPQSREVTVALYLSNIKLAALTEIVVQGQTNARAARR